MTSNYLKFNKLRLILDQLAKYSIHHLIDNIEALPTDVTDRRGTKEFRNDLLELLSEYIDKRHFGRFRVCLILGTVLEGETYIQDVEARGLLLPRTKVENKFLISLRRLSDDLVCISNSPNISLLKDRLGSYISYCQLSNSVAQEVNALERILRSRSKTLIRSLLALTELNFLSTHFKLQRLIKSKKIISFFDKVRSPEDFASIISYIVCRANELKPIVEIELMIDIDTHIDSDEVEKTINLGVIIYNLKNTSKAISLFEYKLETLKTRYGLVFKLNPPSLDFEYFQKLGYVREEIVKPLAYYHAMDMVDFQQISISKLAKFTVSRLKSTLTEWMCEPYQRVRLKIPIVDGKHFLSPLIDNNCIEDVMYYETLKHEYMILLDADSSIMITDNLDINSLLKISKSVSLFSYLNTWSIALYNDSDNLMSYNSLVRALNSQEFIDELSRYGFESKSIEDFLNLISWNVTYDKFYDIQYRPIIKIEDNYILLPAAFCSSNILRNTQVSNKFRLQGKGQLFVNACKLLLQKNFKLVACERRVRSKQQFTDIDLVVLNDTTLYLFECKHSIPPCSYHEMRDIWRDIRKGVQQLKLAITALSEPSKRKSYLAGWFPGGLPKNSDEIIIKPCILCSHRIFSGMAIDNIPIRDFQSFSVLMKDSILSMSTVDNKKNEITKICYSTNSGDSIGYNLDEYLSENSRYFGMFEKEMTQVTFMNDFISNNKIRLASETFIYSAYFADVNNEYIAKMDSLGFRRLPDMVSNLTLPVTEEELTKIWAQRDSKHAEEL